MLCIIIKLRQAKMEGCSCKEIVSNNTKEHFKWVIYGAIVLLLFWLDVMMIDSQSFKFGRKFYLLHPAFSSFLLGW